MHNPNVFTHFHIIQNPQFIRGQFHIGLCYLSRYRSFSRSRNIRWNRCLRMLSYYFAAFSYSGWYTLIISGHKESGMPSWAASKCVFRKLFRGSENELSREQSEMDGTVWPYLHLLFWDQTCGSDRRPRDPHISYGKEF